MRALIACLLLSILQFSSRAALAQTDQERATARAAATEGVDAFDAGQYDKALQLFERAEALIHAPTHLLFVARCQEKLGKLVEAREAYRKVVTENLDANAPRAFQEAQASAREEADGIDARIGKLAMHISGPSGTALSNLVVTVDGELVPAAMLGLNVPMNPGSHEVVLKADGMKTLSTAVTLAEGEAKAMTWEMVPGPSVVAAQNASVAEDESPSHRERQQGNSRSTWGWVAVTTGAIAVGTGAGFGIISRSQVEKARRDDALCSSNTCTGDGWRHVEVAQRNALIADISMGVGVAAVGVGVYLLVSGKKSPEVGGLNVIPSVDQHGGLVSLRGGF